MTERLYDQVTILFDSFLDRFDHCLYATQMAVPKNETEFRDFILAFESGELPKHQWHHPEHVAMAFWYLTHFDEKTAIEKMRKGIQFLNAKHDVVQTPAGGYHETWTIFFGRVLSRFINEEFARDLPAIQQMERAIQYLSDFRGITREYYSRDLIMSWEARTSWVEPDLKSL